MTAKPSFRLVLLGSLMLVVSTHAAPRARGEQTLAQVLMNSSRPQPYAATDREELAAVETLFVRTLQVGDEPGGLTSDWEEFGWQLHLLRQKDQPLWLLREAPDQARGRGFYAIRPHRTTAMVLQAPHSFSDKYTRELARQLFQDGPFAAAAWNTVPRKAFDATHTSEHTFNAFTRAVVRACPQAYVVQVHGFATRKRQTVAGQTADLIVSNGSSYPDALIRRAASLFDRHLPDTPSRLFPIQVQELGGTTNTQAQSMRDLGSTRFMHLELSQRLRLRLLADSSARQLFLKSLVDFADYSDCSD